MENLYQSHNTPRQRVKISFGKKSKTKQSFKDECDINKIIARHSKTGAISHLNKNNPGYGYATGQDFATAMRTVTDAQNQFNNLSEEIQTRFAGDPGQLLDFVHDPENKAEGAQLGLWPEDPTEALKEPQKPPETRPGTLPEVKKSEKQLKTE